MCKYWWFFSATYNGLLLVRFGKNPAASFRAIFVTCSSCVKKMAEQSPKTKTTQWAEDLSRSGFHDNGDSIMDLNNCSEFYLNEKPTEGFKRQRI